MLAGLQWPPFIERLHMNTDHFSAEFGALTDEEQTAVTGGDWSLAGAIGYAVGYTVASMELALAYDYNLIKKLI